jgi:hypothetical protein
MRLVGAGLSKTGTTSLHRALGTLGFRSLHYDTKRLNDILDGSVSDPDFRRYDDVDAVLDIPSACFFEELLAAYPDSKCILTVRDEDAWWKSIEAHFNQKSPVRTSKDNPFKWRLRHYVYGSATAQEFLFRKRYREHNERVISTVPAERLLVLDITAGDGWEKLCSFLNIAEPNALFPHVNQQDEYSVDHQARAIAELAKLVPSGSRFILVDECMLDVSTLSDRVIIPFLERSGAYWGKPEDDATAIQECDRVRASGAEFIVFAWPAFWWLDHYGAFHRFLRSKYQCVLQTDRFIVFDLREAATRALATAS